MDIKEAIRSIGASSDIPLDHRPLIDLMRPWLVITGLEFQDAVHLTVDALTKPLATIYQKFRDVVDIFDEDQLREAACRVIGVIVIHYEPFEEEGIVLARGVEIRWSGESWKFGADPKMRLMKSCPTFAQARDEVRKMLAETNDESP